MAFSRIPTMDATASPERLTLMDPIMKLTAPASEKLIPRARPMMRAAIMMFLDYWKSVLFSTMFLIPMAEIIP